MRFLVVLALAIGIAAMLSSCFDPPMGEISIIATKSGQRTGCGVMLFNAKGVQIDQVSTDMQGLVYIKNVKPGKYSLKFVNYDGSLYPALINVTVGPGEEKTVRVDLNKTYDAAEGSTEE